MKNILNIKLLKDLTILLCLWIIVWLLSFQPQFLHFPDYDWFNYHFYNCWAFLNNRMGVDFLVSNLRTCINPIIDLPQYFLFLKLGSHPYIFLFLTAFDNALILFLVYKISDYVFIKTSKITTFLKNAFCIAYVTATPIMVRMFGFDGNDTGICVLCLLGFYILLKNLFLPYEKTRNIMIAAAGLFFGAAFGLKLTAVGYCISIVLICILLIKKIEKPFITIFYLCAGMFLSFIVLDGFWLYKCCKYYNNPVFPYCNDIFKSGFAAAEKLADYTHLKPSNLKEFIFYPFFKSHENAPPSFGIENLSYDIRYALNFISVCIILPVMLILRKKNINNIFMELISYNNLIFLLLFVIVPFYVNMCLFGTYRYILASSAIYGIVILILIHVIFYKTPFKKIFITVLTLEFLVYAYNASSYDEEFVKDSDNYKQEKIKELFNMPDLQFEDNSYVIVLNDMISAFVVNNNPKAVYLGYTMSKDTFNKKRNIIYNRDTFYNSKIFFSEYNEKLISDLLATDKKIYIIYSTTGYYRILLNELLSLNKEITRTVENCSRHYMFFYDYPKNSVIKCEYNKKDIKQ